MDNMHGRANCSSVSSPVDPDEFSLFLHQIMLRSSSCSSSSLTVQDGNDMQSFRPTCGGLPPEGQELRFRSSSFPGPSRIPLPQPSSGLNSAACVGFASPVACLQGSALNVSSTSVNSADNQLNEYDCESEDGLEDVVAEAPAKPTTSRNASKRSRAAEVHNLSEKRRRSRINEKMKALQNLIPNSNKTDKASMLDEAIEYLKQLQLQVQLLTMRNGVSLYPMCLPGVLQSNEISPMRMGYYEGSRSLNVNMASSVSLDQIAPANILLASSRPDPNQEQASIANVRKLNDSDSFRLESSRQVHPESFQLPLPGSSKGICAEKLPSQLVNEDLSWTNATEGYVGGKATSSIPFNEQASDLSEGRFIENHAFLVERPIEKDPQETSKL